MFEIFKGTPVFYGSPVVFAIMLFAIELFFMFMFGFYVKYQTSDMTSGYLESYYPWWQDIHVMMLIGYGFTISFTRNRPWSTIGLTFVINAIVFQMHILWSGYWYKAFKEFIPGDRWIYMNISTLIKASFCVAAVLIAMSASVGRIGPIQLLVFAIIMTIGYSFNEMLIGGGGLTVYDIGGTMYIHLFAATAGLVSSFILGRKFPIGYREPIQPYSSYVFGAIGLLFLWMYWPSFNSALLPATYVFQRMAVIHNTILALTGGVLGTVIFAIMLRGRFDINDVLYGTVAGGVAIGASSSLLFNSGGAIAIGFIAGMISTIAYSFCCSRIADGGFFDMHGIFAFHFLPGLFGGLVSAIVIAAYNSVSLTSLTSGNAVNFAGVDYSKQGGLQVAGTFISIGIGLVTGVLGGGMMKVADKVFGPKVPYNKI